MPRTPSPIDVQKQTYTVNGVEMDVKTGQPVTSATSPTDTQLQARTAAAAATPIPTTQDPIKRTIVEQPKSAAEAYLDEFKQPEDVETIMDRRRKESQGLIDSIESYYGDQVAKARERGDERLNETNAVSIVAGLMGSTEAGRRRDVTQAANDKEVQAINNEKALKLAEVYTKIRDGAREEARQQIEDARYNAEQIVARQKERSTEAVNNLKLMAQSGLVDFDRFKSAPENETAYQYALQAVGGSEDALRAMFLINRPQDQIIGTPTRIGNKFVQAYQNPITGKVSYEAIDLPVDLPTEYSNFQKLGDNLVAIPDGWDGDTSKLVTIAGEKSYEEQLRIRGLQLDNAKKERDLYGGGAGEYNGEFAATIKLASQAGGSNAQRAQIEENLKQFIADGDYKSAYAQIVNSTAGTLKGAAATRFQEQLNGLGVMRDLRAAIQEFADAGGDTNILKGSADKIQTKIGALTTDPKYAALATQLDSAFQNYRLQMTGAAFGAQESAEYASVLPSKSNTLDLNLAKLSGAEAYLDSSIKSSIRSAVGDGGIYIKEYAEGASQPAQRVSEGDLQSLAESKGVSASELQEAIAQYGEDATFEFLSDQ